MNNKFLLLSAVTVAATFFNAAAQREDRLPDEQVVTVINNENADASDVQEVFRKEAPTSPSHYGLPRFAIVGKDNKFYLGIGAQFLGEATFDFGDKAGSSVLFVPAEFTPKTPGNGAELGFGWQTSSIYLNFVALPHSDNQLGLFFKGNFLAVNSGFKCYHFYSKYRGLTFGYTTSLFYDGGAMPMTLDFEGPNGFPLIYVFTAYWQQNFTAHLSGAIGIDSPTADYTADALCGHVSQRLPAVPLYLQYGWDGGDSHIRLSGLFRPMQYRNLAENKNTTLTGMGVQLSGITKVTPPFAVMYDIVYGRGIASYIQDDAGLGIDATPSQTPGRLDMVKSLGITGALSYDISSRVSANVTYSHLVNSLPESAVADPEQYRYGDYVAANVIVHINKFLSTGFEYDYGHRKSFDNSSLHANRLQCQLAVTF